jgi:hypothetical protein
MNGFNGLECLFTSFFFNFRAVSFYFTISLLIREQQSSFFPVPLKKTVRGIFEAFVNQLLKIIIEFGSFTNRTNVAKLGRN